MAGKPGASKKKARSGFFTKLLILLLLAGIGWQLYRLNGQVAEAEAERAQLAAQVQSQQQKNAALAEDIENGGTQEQMEEIARDELGLVGPGEKVFYPVSN